MAEQIIRVIMEGAAPPPSSPPPPIPAGVAPRQFNGAPRTQEMTSAGVGRPINTPTAQPVGGRWANTIPQIRPGFITPPDTPSPGSAPTRIITPEMAGALGRSIPGGAGRPIKQFDPMMEALSRLERETQRKQTDEVYRQLRGMPSTIEEAGAKQRQAHLQTIGQSVGQIAGRVGLGGIARGVGGRIAGGAIGNIVGGAGAQIAGGAAGGGVAGGAAPAAVTAAGAGAGALAGVAAVAAPIGIAVAAFTGLGVATAKLTESFVARGRELAAYSPQIAGAQATAGIREIGSDIKEARRLGPNIGRLTNDSSRIDKELRDILLPLKDGVIQVLVPLVKAIAEILQPVASAVNEYGPEIADGVKIAATALVPILVEIQGIAALVRWLTGNEEEKKFAERNVTLEDFLRLGNFAGQPGMGRGGDPVNRVAKTHLNIPAFGHAP